MTPMAKNLTYEFVVSTNNGRNTGMDLVQHRLVSRRTNNFDIGLLVNKLNALRFISSPNFADRLSFRRHIRPRAVFVRCQ